MPADPIEFRIVQSIQTALKGIKTADGYHHTVKGWAVKLDPEHKVEDLIGGANDPIGPPRPFIVLELPAAEEFQYFPSNQIRLAKPFVVHAINNSDPTEDDAKLRAFHRLCADVETAIAVDITRGGLAVDTRILGRQMREHDGQEIWAQVAVQVNLHRTYGAPNG